jgi:type IV pilus modification protein PilV
MSMQTSMQTQKHKDNTSVLNASLHKQSAFSLVEVLIALLILAIGMLAFAASEIMGQRGTHGALKRSHATTLANDLAERIHANPTGNYIKALTKASCAAAPGTTCAATQGGAAVSKCTPDEMASFDLWEWFCGNGSYRGGVITLLGGPGGERPVSANVTCTDPDTTDQLTCTSGLPYNISLNWEERDPNRDPETSNQAHGDMLTKQLDVVVVP